MSVLNDDHLDELSPLIFMTILVTILKFAVYGDLSFVKVLSDDSIKIIKNAFIEVFQSFKKVNLNLFATVVKY